MVLSYWLSFPGPRAATEQGQEGWAIEEARLIQLTLQRPQSPWQNCLKPPSSPGRTVLVIGQTDMSSKVTCFRSVLSSCLKRMSETLNPAPQYSRPFFTLSPSPPRCSPKRPRPGDCTPMSRCTQSMLIYAYLAHHPDSKAAREQPSWGRRKCLHLHRSLVGQLICS